MTVAGAILTESGDALLAEDGSRLVTGRTSLTGRDISATFKAAIEGPVVYPIFLVEMEFPEVGGGTLRLTTEMQDRVWDGKTWLGKGWFLGVSNVDEVGDIRATSFTVSLQGNSPEFTSIALRSVRQNLPVRLYFGLLAPRTGPGQRAGELIADPVLVTEGLLDKSAISPDPKNPAITINYQDPGFADLEQPRIRRYTHEDQQIDHPGDNFFKFVGPLADATIPWGFR